MGAILSQPEKFEGKTLCAAVVPYTLDEIAGILSKATEKKVIYEQVAETEFGLGLPGFLAGMLAEGLKYQEEVGYFGERTDEKVTWARENALGKPTTFEEFFEENPLVL